MSSLILRDHVSPFFKSPIEFLINHHIRDFSFIEVSLSRDLWSSPWKYSCKGLTSTMSRPLLNSSIGSCHNALFIITRSLISMPPLFIRAHTFLHCTNLNLFFPNNLPSFLSKDHINFPSSLMILVGTMRVD
jgi:hypothetical protein